MTIHNLIGEYGKDVVIEADQVQEFVAILEDLAATFPDQNLHVDYSRLRTARRIVGRRGPNYPGSFGHCCGRAWRAEYGETRLEPMKCPPHACLFVELKSPDGELLRKLEVDGMLDRAQVVAMVSNVTREAYALADVMREEARQGPSIARDPLKTMVLNVTLSVGVGP